MGFEGGGDVVDGFEGGSGYVEMGHCACRSCRGCGGLGDVIRTLSSHDGE
jgi:hypothetical protein